jgi:hypothetical protein
MNTMRVLDEDPIPLASLRAQISNPPKYRRLHRWVWFGLLIKAGPRRGERVTLDHCFQGGTLVTSLKAYRRFLKAVNGKRQKRKPNHA